MPPKRKGSEDGSDGTSSVGGTPKKPRAFNGKAPWTVAEDHKLIEHIDKLVKDKLWAAVKNDPELSGRGANGIRTHWEVMVKKMKK
ncbi:hypothetical protein IAU59_006573 [Kwoniella sp. CBS 9459]